MAACKNTFSNHCFNNRADLTCIDRYGRDRPFCSGCVSENDGCVLNEDCPAPELAHCTDTQECDGCTDDMHCSHLPDTPICEDTVCVECLDEDDCGGNVCDRKYLTCTNAVPGSAGSCEPCVATAQCEADMACVQMNVDGTDTGYFCQWLQTAPNVMMNCGDVRPFGDETSKPYIEGGTADVCSLRFASCEAYDDMVKELPCDAGEHDDCGIVRTDDGGAMCSVARFDVSA